MTSNATHLTLPGRLLLLCRDPARITLQLQGTDLTLLEAGPLRDDISTDEITPVAILSHYDDALGRYPYTGFRVDGKSPIGVNAVRDGGFSVVVAGQRYGKGSSREHSPAAEQLAGIRLVIAASFERIYRQNADNIGLFTSTDFGLITRIQRGAAIAVDELVADRDALAATILKSGGLLRFGQLHMGSVRSAVPAAAIGRPFQACAPQTLFEKIIARHALPTGASSTSTTPACAPTCCTPLLAGRWRCMSRPPSSCSKTTPPTWRAVRPICRGAWCPMCGPCARCSATLRTTMACVFTAR